MTAEIVKGQQIRNVAVYCRVSTNISDQADSLENQIMYFENYVNNHPFWKLYKIYVDEGITGTSTKKREAFNQMITDAYKGLFDLILTKEISRFARNTLDSIFYTRQMKKLGVEVFFLNDNIHTFDTDSELRLTIMSSIAQEESRKTSQRVKWGQQRRMEQGVVFGRSLLGYEVANGKITINQKQAETVRLIFHKYVNEGKGAHTIACELCKEGIAVAGHMKQWSNTNILRILKNEKYCGDLVQKKTITPDYLNHEKKYNKGQEKMIIIRNHHQPIISRKLFEEAQSILKKRRLDVNENTKYSSRYCFSGKIKCALCSCSYAPRSKKRKDGSVYRAWRCSRAARYGSIKTKKNEISGCDNAYVNEDALKNAIQNIIKKINFNKNKIAKDVACDVKKSVLSFSLIQNLNNIDSSIKNYENKRRRLMELYLCEGISKEEYLNTDKSLKCSLERLYAQKKMTNVNSVNSVCDEIYDYALRILSGEEWSDSFFRCVINTITVNKDKLKINFNSPLGKFSCIAKRR